MASTDQLATRMARAENPFTRPVVDKVSLRDLVPEMGVGYDTIRSDVTAFRTYLASEQAELKQRRATSDAALAAHKAKALYVFEKYKDTKPLTTVAALSSVIATLTHQRALQGLDMPRETKIEQSGEIHIVWDDGDTARPQHQYPNGEGSAPPLPRADQDRQHNQRPRTDCDANDNGF